MKFDELGKGITKLTFFIGYGQSNMGGIIWNRSSTADRGMSFCYLDDYIVVIDKHYIYPFCNLFDSIDLSLCK